MGKEKYIKNYILIKKNVNLIIKGKLQHILMRKNIKMDVFYVFNVNY